MVSINSIICVIDDKFIHCIRTLWSGLGLLTSVILICCFLLFSFLFILFEIVYLFLFSSRMLLSSFEFW